MLGDTLVLGLIIEGEEELPCNEEQELVLDQWNREKDGKDNRVFFSQKGIPLLLSLLIAHVQAFIIYAIVECSLQQERQYRDEDCYESDCWHVGDPPILLALLMADVLIDE
jgi:hypothetical protein